MGLQVTEAKVHLHAKFVRILSKIHTNIVTAIFLCLGDDYVLHTLTFPSCEERACTSVTFVDDDIPEKYESLTISLVRTADLDQKIILSSESEEVIILNDDGMLIMPQWASFDGNCKHSYLTAAVALHYGIIPKNINL